ncbi:hypothetical protein N7481_007937 [Penicillium waksmanii]|uniref:uncharacterized protein n=1 Tax=Penicillium waksmanii TaxID=69791 RepID=UPI002547B113|nr:uncharacterized protein N7481_007937 [Penicillium waksmanii]KAJ5980639.1 hypothetical protein N7481_007937 [Penicillium waksmanii]
MADETITPAMPPPAGQTSNFINPDYTGTKFIAVNSVFLPLAVIALAVRTWTRLFVVRSFRWDDSLMLSCALTGVTSDMLNWGLGKHMWDVPLSHLTPQFMKLNVIAAILYCAATGFTKCSVLIFYLRIFPSRNFHIAVWSIVFIAAGYSLASILANILSCSPVAMAWDLSITSGHCMNRPVFYFANAGLGIFTDFATVIVPIPWLRRLQMPNRQKIAVGVILAMGCFVGIVSCIRLVTLYKLLESPDLTWVTTDALMCYSAIHSTIFPGLLGHSSGGGYGSSRSRKYGHPLGSIPRSDHPDFTNGENQYSATLTAHGAHENGSEEHILSTPRSAEHNKEVEAALGIVRTVEFDVENSSTSAR